MTSPFTIPPRDGSNDKPAPFTPQAAAAPTPAPNPVAPVESAPAVARPPKASPFTSRAPFSMPTASPDDAPSAVSQHKEVGNTWQSSPPAPSDFSAPAQFAQPEMDRIPQNVQEEQPASIQQEYTPIQPQFAQPQEQQVTAYTDQNGNDSSWVSLIPSVKDAFLIPASIVVGITFVWTFLRSGNGSLGTSLTVVGISVAIALGIVFAVYKAQHRVKVDLQSNQIEIKGKVFNLHDVDYLLADFVLRGFGTQVKFVVGSGKVKSIVTVRMVHSKKNVLKEDALAVFYEAIQRFNVPDSYEGKTKGKGTHQKTVVGKAQALDILQSLATPAEAQ